MDGISLCRCLFFLAISIFFYQKIYSPCFGEEQQAKQGKVPDELVERLHGILGHIMRPNTLKVRSVASSFIYTREACYF